MAHWGLLNQTKQNKEEEEEEGGEAWKKAW
jgi:hypothetical protein